MEAISSHDPSSETDNETTTGRCRCPSRCFCHYDTAELLKIADKKLRAHIPTVELMRDARSARERELVCVVSMLDIEDAIAEIMIRQHMSDATCDVMGCRDDLRNRLLAALNAQ